jgi:hypothetical protein
MFKYVASILALSLIGCGGSAVNTTTAHAAVPSETTPALGTPSNIPITVELAEGETAQAMRCSDGLDCMQKLTGLCSNGYQGGRFLTGENNRVVGVLYRCITDQEKAQAAAEEAQEKAMAAAYKAAREARLKEMQEAAQKTQEKKTQTPKKK